MANLITKLQSLFRYKTTNKTIEPTAQSSLEGKSLKDTFPREIKQLWDWYLSETIDTHITLADRENRYSDADYMVHNEPIISQAVDLYADEVSQTDDKFQLFKINSSNPEVVKEIKTLFDRLNINQPYIREVAYDMILFGDSFDIIDANPTEGITGLTSVDVNDISSRLEFKASEIEKLLSAKRGYKISIASNSIKKYINDMSNLMKQSPSAAYQSYLLGYILGKDHYLAPWQVLHYRLNSRRSEFFPYGRPLFVNLIGPYRQLKTSMNFLALARPLKFPKQLYTVNTSDSMTSSEKWDAVNEARQEYENSGLTLHAKDEFALNESIWLPKDLIEFESISNDINLDDIADIELLRDNLIMGTGIPKGYLITSEMNWGTSGQSLLQQSKPFARAAYRIQAEIMDRLSFLIKLHFLISGKFEKEFTEFELEMNFPVVEDSSDRLNAKKDSIEFASDIIDNIKDAIGYTGDNVPPELIKTVYRKYSFLSNDEISDIVDKLYKVKKAELNGETPEEENEELLNERLNEFILDTAYFEACKKNNITERNINGRHSCFYSGDSINKSDNNVFNMMRTVNESRAKCKLKENAEESLLRN